MLSGVPPLLNNIESINRHFKKYGVVVDVKIKRNEGEAYVEFDAHTSARKVMQSAEPVLNNRFIRLFWANEDRTGSAGTEIPPLVKPSDPLVTAIATAPNSAVSVTSAGNGSSGAANGVRNTDKPVAPPVSTTIISASDPVSTSISAPSSSAITTTATSTATTTAAGTVTAPAVTKPTASVLSVGPDYTKEKIKEDGLRKQLEVLSKMVAKLKENPAGNEEKIAKYEAATATAAKQLLEVIVSQREAIEKKKPVATSIGRGRGSGGPILRGGYAPRGRGRGGITPTKAGGVWVKPKEAVVDKTKTSDDTTRTAHDQDEQQGENQGEGQEQNDRERSGSDAHAFENENDQDDNQELPELDLDLD